MLQVKELSSAIMANLPISGDLCPESDNFILIAGQKMVHSQQWVWVFSEAGYLHAADRPRENNTGNNNNYVSI